MRKILVAGLVVVGLLLPVASFGGEPDIVLTKTVGLNPGSCATSNIITVTANTGFDVTYCYRAGNPWGNSTTYTQHVLVDSVLGPIELTNMGDFDLPDGQETVITQTATITQSVTNTAWWTAGPITVTASDTATVRRDADGDYLLDENDPRINVPDPTGCFYDVRTAKIIPGGSVVPSGTGVTMLNDGSATGCYQFLVDVGVADIVNLAVTPPEGCVLWPCPRQDPPFDPFADFDSNTPQAPCTPGGASGLTCVMGAFEDTPARPGFLTAGGCQPLAFAFDFDPGDGDVINNNIPLSCAQLMPVPAPVVSARGCAAVALVLGLIGLLALRRRSAQV